MIRLITPERVIELSFSNETNETSMIKDAIIEAAQLRWIRPVLGNDLWDLLESEYPDYSAANAVLTAKLETPLAFFVKGELIPDMSINTTAAGLQVITTEYSSPATDKQRGQIQDQAFIHAQSLLAEVTRWIELDANINDYPDYYQARNITNTIAKKGGLLF